jgi:hypothetical protein
MRGRGARFAMSTRTQSSIPWNVTRQFPEGDPPALQLEAASTYGRVVGHLRSYRRRRPSPLTVWPCIIVGRGLPQVIAGQGWDSLIARFSFRRRSVEKVPDALRIVDNLYATLAYL